MCDEIDNVSEDKIKLCRGSKSLEFWINFLRFGFLDLWLGTSFRDEYSRILRSCIMQPLYGLYTLTKICSTFNSLTSQTPKRFESVNTVMFAGIK